jgi:hypothetical protein
MALRPNNDIVGVGWIKLVSDTYVATDLPQDNTTWGASGFTTLEVVGGTPNNDVPIASPVYEVTCWAAPAAAGSTKPPWNRANARAEVLRAAVLAHRLVPRTVTLPAAYDPARVLQAAIRTEPRRVEHDRADYAGYMFDLQLWWTS